MKKAIGITFDFIAHLLVIILEIASVAVYVLTIITAYSMSGLLVACLSVCFPLISTIWVLVDTISVYGWLNTFSVICFAYLLGWLICFAFLAIAELLKKD